MQKKSGVKHHGLRNDNKYLNCYLVGLPAGRGTGYIYGKCCETGK